MSKFAGQWVVIDPIKNRVVAVGKSLEDDLRTLIALDERARQEGIVYVLDFNAQYSVEEMEGLLLELN